MTSCGSGLEIGRILDLNQQVEGSCHYRPRRSSVNSARSDTGCLTKGGNVLTIRRNLQSHSSSCPVPMPPTSTAPFYSASRNSCKDWTVDDYDYY